MATNSLMLSTPARRSLTAVRTMGYPRIIAPTKALALATALPCVNSQSTMNALRTNTTPSSVCHKPCPIRLSKVNPRFRIRRGFAQDLVFIAARVIKNFVAIDFRLQDVREIFFQLERRPALDIALFDDNTQPLFFDQLGCALPD